MSDQEAKLKAAIDETLAPRLANFEHFQGSTNIAPFVVERAELLYVRDPYGKQYLDFSNPFLPVGHGNAAVVSRIREQLNHYTHVGHQAEFVQRWPVEYAEALSKSLLSATQGDLRVVFYESAQDAYDEATYVSLRIEQDSYWVEFVNAKGAAERPDLVQERVRGRRENFDQIIIADERITGFGRTGTNFWAQHKWGVQADVTIVGSAGGGGFPFGAVVAPAWFCDRLADPTPTAGNPLICAAGYETFLRVTDGILDHVEDAGAGLFNALDTISKQFPSVIDSVHGVGLLQTLHFPSPGHAVAFRAACLGYGLLLAQPSNASICLTPPLIISEVEARRGADMMAAACLDLEE